MSAEEMAELKRRRNELQRQRLAVDPDFREKRRNYLRQFRAKKRAEAAVLGSSSGRVFKSNAENDGLRKGASISVGSGAHTGNIQAVSQTFSETRT